MNTEDLRVVKTLENIDDSFQKLMKKKPFEKITIRDICTEARISKGTFYYHYQDIYDFYGKYIERNIIESLLTYIDCYDTVIEDPVKFLRELRSHKLQYNTSFMIILQGKTMSAFKKNIIDGFIEKTYEMTGLKKSIMNDAKLHTLFNIMLM